MPEIDGSIATKIAVPQSNPFETIGRAVALKQGLLQNQMLQQDFAARQGLGQAYQAAIDPQSGELDTNKLLGIAAQDPRIAYKAGELVKEAQERQLQQAGITSAQAKAYKDHLDITGGAVSALLASKEPLTRDVVAKAAANLLSNPAISPELRRGMLGDVTTLISQMGDNPDANREMITQLALRNLDAQQRLGALFPTPQARDVGPDVQIQSESPFTGVTPLATMQKGLSPAEATAPTPVMATDANGNPVQAATTRGQFAAQAQATGAVPTGVAMPGGLPMSTLAETVQVIDPVTHQPKVITKGELLGIQTPGGLKSPTTGGGVATGLAPGQTEGLAVQGAESAKQANALMQRADQVPERKAALSTMNDLVGKFSAGPAADQIAKLGALASQFGVAGPDTKKATSAKEEFDKLSQAIIIQQIGQLGTGTDAKLEAGLKGNPSSYLSQLGSKNVLALMRGNEDAIGAKNAAWQKWLQSGHTPDSYGQFAAQFNKLYDPRVFQAVYMSPENRAAMLKNMTAAEKKAYDEHVRIAVQAGWIK